MYLASLPCEVTMEKRLMMRSACRLRVTKARQHRFLYISNILLPYRYKSMAVHGGISSVGVLSVKWLTSPPMTYTKSGVSTNGAHSLLNPCIHTMGGQRLGSLFVCCFANVLTIKYLMFPRKCPKSMWKRFPDVVTMMLSLCRSPIPLIKCTGCIKYYQ